MAAKKELFIYEMRYMKYFLLLGILCAVGVCIAQYQNLEVALPSIEQLNHGIYEGTYLCGSIFGGYLNWNLETLLYHPVVHIVLMSMTMIQFRDSNSRKVREYVMSLPYTQGQKFCMRVCVGYGIITIVNLVMSTGMVFVRLHFQDAIMKRNMVLANFIRMSGNDTMLHTLRSLLYFWLTMMAIYSVYVLAQCVVHSTILAAIMGSGVLIAPVALYHGLWALSMHVYQLDIPYHRMMTSRMKEQFLQKFIYGNEVYFRLFFGGPMGQERGIDATKAPSGYGVWSMDYPGNTTVSILLFLGIILLCTLLAAMANQRIDLAAANMLVSQKLARTVTGLGIGVCGMTYIIGCLGPASYLMNNSSITKGTAVVLLCVIWLAGVTGFVLLCRKLLKIVIR